MRDLSIFLKKIEDEMVLLEKELARIGRKNPNVEGDWTASSNMEDEDVADDDLVADQEEERFTNEAILAELEIRYNELLEARERIRKNEYGMCTVGGEQHEIEEEKLVVNPASKTCKAHTE